MVALWGLCLAHSRITPFVSLKGPWQNKTRQFATKNPPSSFMSFNCQLSGWKSCSEPEFEQYFLEPLRGVASSPFSSGLNNVIFRHRHVEYLHVIYQTLEWEAVPVAMRSNM